VWLLRPALGSRDIDRARPAFVRWIIVDAAWQAVVLAAGYVYFLAGARAHTGGIAWIAPGLAAILGTALPLQVVVISLLNAARR
jgi:hypothetical protein